MGNRQQLIVNATTANIYNYDADDRLGSDQYDANGNTINSLSTASTWTRKALMSWSKKFEAVAGAEEPNGADEMEVQTHDLPRTV